MHYSLRPGTAMCGNGWAGTVVRSALLPLSGKTRTGTGASLGLFMGFTIIWFDSGVIGVDGSERHIEPPSILRPKVTGDLCINWAMTCREKQTMILDSRRHRSLRRWR
ncbi:hypothetical protein BJY00DRAFT_273446 [Aspergillus carlsbadensis]|nr:hypothetical protein BJY00DRAFT_273446 [Aspergillus carlsbadensis]